MVVNAQHVILQFCFFDLVDHPVLEVVAERHYTHLVDHMKATRPIEIQNWIERSGKSVEQLFLLLSVDQITPGMAVEEVLVVNQAENDRFWKWIISACSVNTDYHIPQN